MLRGHSPLDKQSGTSSVGRARPCQGRGHEFEPRVPLQFILKANPDIEAEWQSGHAPDCKSVYPGSTPGSASNNTPHALNSKLDARVVELVDTRDLKSLD